MIFCQQNIPPFKTKWLWSPTMLIFQSKRTKWWPSSRNWNEQTSSRAMGCYGIVRSWWIGSMFGFWNQTQTRSRRSRLWSIWCIRKWIARRKKYCSRQTFQRSCTCFASGMSIVHRLVRLFSNFTSFILAQNWVSKMVSPIYFGM